MDFILRKWQMLHVDSIAKYANSSKIADNLRDGFPYPYTLKDAREFVKSSIAGDEKTQMLYAIEVDGEAVGSIGVFMASDVYRKSAELGYWLAEKYWGRGIMTLAVKEICKKAFKTFDIVRIFAEPFSHNLGSRAVLERAGFTLEGIMKKGAYKNGEFFDYCMYAIIKDE